MVFLWKTALKDLRRHRRNPVEFLLWIGIPVAIGIIVILAAGGKSGPEPQAHVLIADEDDSFISNFLIASMSQEASASLIRAESVTQADGREMMAAGKASALLIVPEGFSDAVLREEPTTLRLLTNPSQRVLPGIVEESLSIMVDGAFYLHRLVGGELRAFADGPPAGQNTFNDALVAASSVRINQIVDRLAQYLSPLAIELIEDETSADAEQDEGSGWALYFLPGILFMGLLFMSQGLGDEFWHERNARTLRRVMASPQSLTTFLAGKLLAGGVLVCVVCAVGLGIGYAYFELSLWTLPLALAWSVCAGMMLMTLMLVIQLCAKGQRAGNILTMVLIFPLMMLGGSFFPFEAMPSWMSTVGKLTPNGWALQQLREILIKDFDVPGVAAGFLGLLALVGVLFWLCAMRLRRGFAQG